MTDLFTGLVLPDPSRFFPLAIATAGIYAIWSWFYYRRQLRIKPRSEESRSPPRRGRKLGRGLGLDINPVLAAGKGTSEAVAEGGTKDLSSPFPDLTNLRVTEEEQRQAAEDRRLYHMLQNLEDYPESVELARIRLSQLLDQTTSAAIASPSSTVLSVPSPAGLESYFAANHRSAASKYQAYLSRRKRGSPRELFPTREFALEWLKLAACVKYVDGAWIANALGAGVRSLGVSKESPKIERDAAKLAWQVISEEFGDGDLQKNHVYVYHQLLRSLSATSAAAGDTINFDNLGPDGGSPRCWSAAVAQQCVGLLAGSGDFFPEALGFNMAYETLPFHLLVTSYELRELRINDYYFALHITIDNPDSGHAAMARTAVEQYLAGVEKRDGTEAMERMWRRVQAGVLLADGLPTTPSGPIEFGWEATSRQWRPVPLTSSQTPPLAIENDMVALLQRKSSAAEHLHCPSRLSFAGQTLEQWLDPSAWTSERGLAFLRVLAEKRPWVVQGDDSKSRLVKELQWGGRMFGAFTDREVALVRRWIASMGNSHDQAKGSYERFIGPTPEIVESVGTVPGRFAKAAATLLPSPTAEDIASVLPRFAHRPTPLDHTPPLSTLSSHLQAALLLTSLSLLDLFPLHPSKFACPLGCTVLRIMRAQLGFPALHRAEDICAGTDEADLRGLWEVAEEHFRTKDFPLPNSLLDLARLVEADDSAEARSVASLCADLLAIRLHPYAQTSLLLEWTEAAMAWWVEVLGHSDVVRRVELEVREAMREYEPSSGSGAST